MSACEPANIYLFVFHTQVLIICDFGGFRKRKKERMVVRGREGGCFLIRVTVVLLSPAPRQTKWHFLTVPIPVWVIWHPKIRLRGKQGDEAPQPYPGKEMASYQIRLGSLFYGVNLYRGDKEMTHPLRTQREKEISPPAAYMALVQPDRQRIERSWNNNPPILPL